MDDYIVGGQGRNSSTGADGGMTEVVLSALVVVHNEEAQLADCLELLNFADELVVVLDKCTDGSKVIAEEFNARLVEGAWEIEGHRRNAGLESCRGAWILEVDADERANPDLGREVCSAIKGLNDGYFLLPFDNYIGDRLVRYGWGGLCRAALVCEGGKTLGGAANSSFADFVRTTPLAENAYPPQC